MPRPGPPLPVDPARLRAQFPELTDDDLEAYVEVTRRILAGLTTEERARITRETLALGRAARTRTGEGATPAAGEALALRYLAAVEKMQGRGNPPGH